MDAQQIDQIYGVNVSEKYPTSMVQLFIKYYTNIEITTKITTKMTTKIEGDKLC